MTEQEFTVKLNSDLRMIERSLIYNLPEANDGQSEVVNAMKYSLSNGGKRIRPVFVLEFAEACGGSKENALPLACAVEYIHTYSLIHDDLPCMDNDDLRRGKPSCHKRFSEATALLAGDALLTHAFELIANSELSNAQKSVSTALLAQNAGVGGMLGGQVIDLIIEDGNPSVKELLTMYKMKTGALISAACILGCIASDADRDKIAAASRFAYDLGVAFQIQDDVLDIIGDEEKLGKPVGSDADNNKQTYASIVGVSKAQNSVKLLTESAIRYLDAFENNDFIKMLALSLINRDK